MKYFSPIILQKFRLDLKSIIQILCCVYDTEERAGIAQMVEQLIRNQ